jgi:hypothetical protein
MDDDVSDMSCISTKGAYIHRHTSPVVGEMPVPALSALKKATIETLGITPRRDGKVEIVLRVLADHHALTECAAQFIRAGVESFKLFDIFKAIAPSDQEDFGLGAKPSSIGPDILSLDRQGRVRMAGPVNIDHLREVNGERPPANDNREAELRRAPDLGELSIHDLATLMGLLETMRQEIASLRAEVADGRSQWQPKLEQLLQRAS